MRFFESKKANSRTLLIAGIAILAYPTARKALRPALIAGTQAIMNLKDKLTGFTAGAQETLEDIVAEAQFKRLQQKAEQNIGRIGNDAVNAAAGVVAGAVSATIQRTKNLADDAKNCIENAVGENTGEGSGPQTEPYGAK